MYSLSDRNVTYMAAMSCSWFAKFTTAVDVVSLNIPIMTKS